MTSEPGMSGAPEAPRGRSRGAAQRTWALPAGDPRAVVLIDVLERGDAARLDALLETDPGLATCLIDSTRPLHIFANAPGHRPNPEAVVNLLATAGADLDAHAIDSWHHETALHWAASNDDVALIDALLDAGADIEHPGSSINGGPPIASAVGYGQWAALRRLWERGAKITVSVAGALGEMPLLTRLAEAEPPPAAEDINISLWNACRAGRLSAAQYLLTRGADLNWPAPWSGDTPLDIATQAHQEHVVAWLTRSGASPAPKAPA
jgi:ankyrin repeat protein